MKSFYLLFLIILCSCTKKYHDPNSSLPKSLEAAVSSDFRTEENVDRDEYQHPAETLNFFGIRPDMTVVEVSPGNGYFTEILAPFLSEQGQLFLAIQRMPPRPSYVLIENEKKIQDILLRNNNIHGKVKIIPFEPVDTRNKTKTSFADMVVTFNTIHNWVAKNSTEGSFKFCFDLLKAGGILGVVEHRIHERKKRVPMSGYMYESEVIKMATKAGFKFVGKSEINANPKDTADYPEGVWTLPPTYRLGKKNHDKYEEIGESDRMTLKFIK